MKQITTFKFEGKASFNQDFIEQHHFRQMTNNQVSMLGFVPLFDDTFVQKVDRFDLIKVAYQERKEPDLTQLEQEAKSQLESEVKEGDTYTDEELDEKILQLREEYLPYQGFKPIQQSLVVLDNQTSKLLVEGGVKKVDNVMSYILGAMEGDYENVLPVEFEAPILEKLLTNYIINESKHLPDPFMLVEKVSLGDKSEFEKSPKSVTISVKKEYPADDEVLAFISNRNKVVKLLQLDYDGVVELEVTNKFEIKGIKFKEDHAFEQDEDSTPSANFMGQYIIQLPTLLKVVNSLEKEATEVDY